MTSETVTALLAQIADVGRDPGTGGYHRLAYTREDAALTEWFTAACRARGFDVSTDRCGNQWAWWGNPDTAAAHGAPGVVVGSHLDSVPDGGAFDGPLGVAAALAAVDLLRAGGLPPFDSPTPARRTRPLGIVRFVDEEGGRFGLACSGSRLLTGLAAPDRVLALRDGDGYGYADAAQRAGVAVQHVGRDEEVLRRIGAFVELHLEQGRGLALLADDGPAGGPRLAVASRIRPHGRWRIDLRGRADHAGTTLLADRQDPMLALAALVIAVRAAAERHDALATVGRIAVRPNAVNAIASSVTAWLDVRADDAAQVRAVLDDVARGVQDADAVVEESWTDATDLDEPLTAQVARAIGGDVPVLATGAGHDAGVLAQAGIASSMLFVRNPTGVSHSPAERADPADCEAGAAALAAVVSRLVGQQNGHMP